MAVRRRQSDKRPVMWNIVRSHYLGEGEFEDKIVRRNLTEAQAVAFIRRMHNRGGDVTYSGLAVRSGSWLLA